MAKSISGVEGFAAAVLVFSFGVQQVQAGYCPSCLVVRLSLLSAAYGPRSGLQQVQARQCPSCLVVRLSLQKVSFYACLINVQAHRAKKVKFLGITNYNKGKSVDKSV